MQILKPFAALPQAFAEWRMLTAYIRPAPMRDDPASKDLKGRIDDAVRRVDKALSPWQLSQKSVSSRRKSLQSILGKTLNGRRGIHVY